MERNPSFYPSRPCGDEHWARTPKSPFLGHGTSLSRCFPHLASHQKVKWYRKIFCGCFWFPDSPPSTLLESVCMLLLLKPVKKKKTPKNHNKNCELEMLCKNKKLFVIFTQSLKTVCFPDFKSQMLVFSPAPGIMPVNFMVYILPGFLVELFIFLIIWKIKCFRTAFSIYYDTSTFPCY